MAAELMHKCSVVLLSVFLCFLRVTLVFLMEYKGIIIMIETAEDIHRRLEESAKEMYEYLSSLGCDQPPMNVIFAED